MEDNKKKGKKSGLEFEKNTQVRMFFSRAVKIRQENANRLSKCVHFIRLLAALTKKSHNNKKNNKMVMQVCFELVEMHVF